MASIGGGSGREFTYSVQFRAAGPQAAAQLRAALAQQVQAARAASAQTVQAARASSQQQIQAARAASQQIIQTARAESQSRIQATRTAAQQAQQLARATASQIIEAERRLTAQYKHELRAREQAARQAAAATRAANAQATGGLGGAISRGLGSFAMRTVAPLAAGLGGAALVRTGFDVARDAAFAERTAFAFEKLSGSAARAEVRLRAVQQGANSALSGLEAMRIGVQGTSLGLAKTSEEFGNLATAARAVTFVSPVISDISSAIGEIALAGANMSWRRLDQLGLSVTEVRARFEEYRRTMEGVDDNQRFTAAIIDTLNEKYGELVKTGGDAANTFERASAKFADARLKLGVAIEPGVAQAVIGLAEAMENAATQAERLGNSGAGRFFAMLNEWNRQFDEFGVRMGDQILRGVGLGDMLPQDGPERNIRGGGNRESGIEVARGLAAALEDARARGVFALEELAVAAGFPLDNLGVATLAVRTLGGEIDSLPSGKTIDIQVNIAENILGTLSGLENQAINAAAGLVRQGLATPAQAMQMIGTAQGQIGQFGGMAANLSLTGAPLAVATAEQEAKMLAPFEAMVEAERERKRAADEAARAWKQAADAAKREFEAAAKAARSAFESALKGVPGLFGTSDVTADQMKMAELGVPQNFADNWLRRLSDEVLNGIDWPNVDIHDAAARAGISGNLPAEAILAQVRAQWESGAFFADPRNLELIDQQAVMQQLALQRQSATGQANIFDFFGGNEQLTALTGLSGGLQPEQFGAWAGGVSDAAGAALATQAPRIVDTMNFSLADQLASGETIAGASAVGSGLLDLVWGGYEAGIPTKPWVGALVDHITAEVLEMVSDSLGDSGAEGQ